MKKLFKKHASKIMLTLILLTSGSMHGMQFDANNSPKGRRDARQTFVRLANGGWQAWIHSPNVQVMTVEEASELFRAGRPGSYDVRPSRAFRDLFDNGSAESRRILKDLIEIERSLYGVLGRTLDGSVRGDSSVGSTMDIDETSGSDVGSDSEMEDCSSVSDVGSDFENDDVFFAPNDFLHEMSARDVIGVQEPVVPQVVQVAMQQAQQNGAACDGLWNVCCEWARTHPRSTLLIAGTGALTLVGVGWVLHMVNGSSVLMDLSRDLGYCEGQLSTAIETRESCLNHLVNARDSLQQCSSIAGAHARSKFGLVSGFLSRFGL